MKAQSYTVIDQFLPPSLHDKLLAYVLASEHQFIPSQVYSGEGERYDPDARLSWKCEPGLGNLEVPFLQAVEQARPDILTGLGLKPFPEKTGGNRTCHP